MFDSSISPRRHATVKRGEVDACDIVTTGCGRVYVFPSELPSFRREAGLNHFSYRVGYVERRDGMWVPRDFGNYPLGAGTGSRDLAVRRVVEDAGWTINGYPEGDTLVPLHIPVALAHERNPIVGGVVLDFGGQVHVAQRIDRSGLRVLETLGSVWSSGDRVMALPDGAGSNEPTVHYSPTDAVHALIAESAFVRTDK